MNKIPSWQLAGLLIAIAITLYFFSQDYLTLAGLQAQRQALLSYYQDHPVITILSYSLLYIVVTGLSLPGATILTLAGGALFGFGWGVVIVSFASTIGATLAFWAARYFFREEITAKFAAQLALINQNIEQDGAYYLFGLRLVPLFPFFAINLLMGLTAMKSSTYYWVSQLGMLPGTILYVNAGTQLASLQTLADLASPLVVGSLTLLGIFPLAAKKIIEHLRYAGQ